MPDVAILFKESFSNEESSDDFDLDFRVVSIEAPSKGPGPDYLGGRGGCSGDPGSASCVACTFSCSVCL